MNPIDLKAIAASHFKIGFDEAALIEPGGKKDPWYLIIPCKNGQIYPYSDKLLAIYSKGLGIRKKLSVISWLVNHNWSEDGEAIFLFPPELFVKVAEIVKPKRKRRLSEAQRQESSNRLRDYRFKRNSAHVKVENMPKNGPIQLQAIVGAQ